MLRYVRVFFRCLYLFLAVFLLLVGLLAMSEVVPEGRQAGLEISLKMTSWGFGLLWVAVLARMRAANWLLACVLLVGVGLVVNNLILYPAEAYDETQLGAFTPSLEFLHQLGAVLLTLFLLVTLHSARARRVVRRWWPGLRRLSGPETASSRIIGRSHLGIAACLLLAAWVADLYMHREINHYDVAIFLMEGLDFFMALLSFLMFGLGIAFRMHGARRMLIWSLVGGMALSSLAMRFLPLSVADATIAFAPTPDHVFEVWLGSAVMLSYVLLSAPVLTRAVRCWWWRIKNRAFQFDYGR